MFSQSRWAPLFHPTKNHPFTPDLLRLQSNSKCIFICRDNAGRASHCGYEWEDKIANVTRKGDGNPCPHCRSVKPVLCGKASCAMCRERSVLNVKLAPYRWIVDRNLDEDQVPLNPLHALIATSLG